MTTLENRIFNKIEEPMHQMLALYDLEHGNDLSREFTFRGYTMYGALHVFFSSETNDNRRKSVYQALKLLLSRRLDEPLSMKITELLREPIAYHRLLATDLVEKVGGDASVAAGLAILETRLKVRYVTASVLSDTEDGDANARAERLAKYAFEKATNICMYFEKKDPLYVTKFSEGLQHIRFVLD